MLCASLRNGSVYGHLLEVTEEDTPDLETNLVCRTNRRNLTTPRIYAHTSRNSSVGIATRY